MKFGVWLLVGVWACLACVAWARPQSPSFVDTITAPFNSVAGVTTNTVSNMVDSANNFFSDTGSTLSRFTDAVVNSGRNTFNSFMEMINRGLPTSFNSS